jgi:endonuclease V-like protein UPF0215 family
MKSVADDLRREQLAIAAAQSPAERVAVALQLGDADARMVAGAHGVDPSHARRLIARQRQHGRTPSPCHESLLA